MKTCTKCDKEQETTEFHKDRQKKDGLCSICKLCNQMAVDKWQKDNSEKCNENTKKWQEQNPDQVKITARNYGQNNKGIVNANTAKRYTSKIQRTPPWLTKKHLEDIREFYILAQELQWLSDPMDPLQVDHIVPLQGEIVSGLHVPWNLQVLPKSLNCRKSNRL